ncbi:DUF4148 domain-containing protein [Paraburkholderia caribensis]|uniref:DUF4148 domain-containing protein n=1 Tax=Paraburkholderia caribensis TaxID=75105 RepID=UPI001CB4C448|nr:DUF4148 domain-containing protein [Paraburkholderia caribensis]CAG9243729.1 conserved exported hypothetical protein [Paraburkholderia caribensis]
MKLSTRSLLVGIAFVLPILAHAQESNKPATRAEVQADLEAVVKAGYHPLGRDPHYPDDIQAAEAKVRQSQMADGGGFSYGGVATAGSQAGSAGGALRNNESFAVHH